MDIKSIFKDKGKYKPKKNDVVKVKVAVDRKKRYRMNMEIPYKIVQVDKKNKEVVVVKVGFEEDRGVEGWTLFYEDVEKIKNSEG